MEEKNTMNEENLNNVENNEAAAEEIKAEVVGEETNAEEAKAEEKKEPTVEEQLATLKDQYLRQAAEFENYRKRVLKEKADLIKYGAEGALKNLLPVIDDFERAVDHMQKTDDVEALREGVMLIYQKFQKYLEQNKVTVIPAAQGDTFDETLHEAVTMFPAPDESLKGKIVDCVTKGYKLDDKVMRYAKVVVGQ